MPERSPQNRSRRTRQSLEVNAQVTENERIVDIVKTIFEIQDKLKLTHPEAEFDIYAGNGEDLDEGIIFMDYASHETSIYKPMERVERQIDKLERLGVNLRLIPVELG